LLERRDLLGILFCALDDEDAKDIWYSAEEGFERGTLISLGDDVCERIFLLVNEEDRFELAKDIRHDRPWLFGRLCLPYLFERELVSRWVRPKERPVRRQKRVRQGRDSFKAEIDPRAPKRLFLNYRAWRIPVRKEDIDENGKLIEGKGSEILERYSLSQLAPLFMTRPLKQKKHNTKMRQEDIDKALADAEIFERIGEARDEEEKPPRVGLFEILHDIGARPRKSIGINEFIRLMNGLTDEAKAELVNINGVWTGGGGGPLIKFRRQKKYRSPIVGRGFADFRLWGLLNDFDCAAYGALFNERIKSEIYWSDRAPYGQSYTKPELWYREISDSDDWTGEKSYFGLTVLDRFRLALAINESNPWLYETVLVPDLTGRKLHKRS